MVVDFGKALDYFNNTSYRKLEEDEPEIRAACRSYLLTAFKHAETELKRSTEPKPLGFNEQ